MSNSTWLLRVALSRLLVRFSLALKTNDAMSIRLREMKSLIFSQSSHLGVIDLVDQAEGLVQHHMLLILESYAKHLTANIAKEVLNFAGIALLVVPVMQKIAACSSSKAACIWS